ncbi:MAG: hypothetical protein ACXW1Y_02130 [Acidimicrobiia bacterium]
MLLELALASSVSFRHYDDRGLPDGSEKRSNIERLFELTSAPRSRRLRGIATAALKAYEFDVEGMRVMSTATNGVFRVDGQTASATCCGLVGDAIGHSLSQVRSATEWL